MDEGQILLRHSEENVFPVGKVESFELAEGEILCLHLDEALGSRLEKALARALGRDVGVADPVRNCRFSIRNVTARRYLGRHLADDKDIAMIIDRMGISANAPLRSLGLTQRMLLGFEAALSAYSVVLFSISGLDPVGVQEVLSYASENLKGRGAILLSYPSTLGRACLHSDKCFAVF